MTRSRMVSIVISNYNAKEPLVECLASLTELDYTNYEVIVVDAGSTDGSARMVAKNFPSVKLVKGGTMGIGEALNRGISMARGEIIVFDLNSDDVVDKNWLRSLVRVLCSSKEVGIVCGKRYRYGSKEILDSIGGRINFFTGETPGLGQGRKDTERYNVQREVDYVGVIVTKREIINKVGLCDPHYYIYFEDTDFCLRVKRAGYKIIYVPSAVFWHKGSSTVGKFSYKSYYYLKRNGLRFIIKDFPLPFMFTALFYSLALKTILDVLVMIPFVRKLISFMFPRFKGYTYSVSDRRLLAALKSAISWNFRNMRRTLQDRYSKFT